MRTLLAAGVLALSTAAWAQEPPKPIDQMTCDELFAEMIAAGSQMKSQLDPRFAANAQAQYDAINDPARRAKATAEMTSLGAICSLPGPAMAACVARQQAYAAEMNAQVKQNYARQAEMKGQLEASMAGIDMQRMMAIEARTRELKCPMPGGPG